MKKVMNWMLAAILIICGASVFTACSSNDDNPTPGSGGQNQWGAETLTFKVNDSSDGFIMKKVEGGDYSMEYMYESEVTTVTGTLSDFYICPVEVTNRLWDAVMGWRPEGQTNNGDSYPVSNVNYYDIVKKGGFIDKLNTICADQLPSGKRFALPTEVQWEYAARGGQKSMGHKYAGSNTIDEVAWYAGNSDGTTHPVGLKRPNELGLYDMTGNVWEYCNDWYADLADIPAAQGTDYAGPESGRVIVGCGGYDSEPYTCTSSYHGREKEHNGRNATVGFRIVLRCLTSH